MNKYLLIFPLFILLVSFQSNLTKNTDFILQIETSKQFEDFAGQPLSSKFNEALSLKLVWDLKTDKIYFFNSKRYQYHNEFCTYILHDYGSVASFNAINYQKNPKRDYVLATINFFPSNGIYTLEFASSESFSDQNKILFDKVKDLVFFKDALQFYPGTSSHINFLEANYPSFNYLSSSDLYNNLNYQVLYRGKAYGKLKFINADNFDANDISVFDIVVLNTVPNELPICQAVITSLFQTPLSHISLLSNNRKMPSMALKEAYNLKELRKWEGKWIVLDIDNPTYKIEAISESKGLAKAKIFSNKKVKIKSPNTSINSLVLIENLSLSSITSVGAKAANFAELNKIKDNLNAEFKTPENAFVLPFYFYLNFIESNGIQKEIDHLSSLENKPNEALNQLEVIKSLIKNASVSPALLNSINLQMRQSKYESYRFRSSTNAEDVKGFNGAGLYASKTAYVNDLGSIEKAILKVWSSLWSYKAYQERLYFGISNENLAMGILIHRSFPNELLNGVILTQNIYRKEVSAYLINVQKGEEPVVDPKDSLVCEQLLLHYNTEENEAVYAEYISYSSLQSTTSLLEDKQLLQLYKAIAKIHSHFYKRSKVSFTKIKEEYVLDLEFKYDIDSEDLYIKQVRPF